MKVCLIWDADYPWDVRVEKTCNALAGAGFEVHLLCRNNERRPPYELSGGIHIHRLPILSSHRKIHEVLSFPAFFNPIWIRHVGRIIKQVGADLILVRDLPLALTGIAIGWRFSLPVVIDMAEDYPDLCKDAWTRRGFKLRNVLVRNPLLAKIVERITIRSADHIIVISADFKEVMVRRGASPEKVSVVMNTPYSTRGVIVTDTIEKRLAHLQSCFKIVYLGILTKSRGLTTAIRAMPIILSRMPQARLVLIGSGNYEPELRALVRKLGLEAYVLFEGWMEHYSALAYVRSCDVGIMPHERGPFIDVTIPNKIFDYMQMGVPVVSSDAKVIVKMMQHVDCGEIFPDGDPQELAGAVFRLSDPATRMQKARNGMTAVAGRYNWETESKTLVRTLEDVWTRNGGRKRQAVELGAGKPDTCITPIVRERN